MFVSTKYARKNKLDRKSDFIILGGPLNNAKLTLVDPTESPDLLDVDEPPDYKNTFGNSITITNPLSKFFLSFPKPKPGSDGERITVLIAGPSGAGKSTFCINYMNVFRHQHKDVDAYPMYFITAIPDNKRLSNLTGCTIIDVLNADDVYHYFVDPETKLTCQQDFLGRSNLNRALVVLDDVEGLDKNLRSMIEPLISDIMKFGRHNSCNLLWSRHILNNANRLIQESLAEIMYIVLFRSDSYKKLVYFCDKYLAQGKELVKYIRKDSGCRYTLIHNRCPFFVMNESSLHVIDD